ncbi:MAG TPA: hypothetical protein VH140_10390 [Candidatus Acidoferrum sp.]|nr:hypothetical protein [Candidatus Acidoferrum sp.]
MKGEFRILFLYEVAEAIRLDLLRPLLEPGGAQPVIGLTPPIPHYLHFERSPVVEAIHPMVLKAGEHIEGKTNYYDYGVVSIELELPFECDDWGALVQRSSRWIGATELESRATELLSASLKHATSALIKPYDTWLKEDYYVVQLREIRGVDGHNLASEELLASHGPEIAQLVRGESALLSDAERQEVLQSSISYSHTDLLVVGWGGALVYGSSEVAATTIQLLEYANTQLLEFRYYDTLLTGLLDEVYRSLERQGGLLTAWRLSREAARLNTIRLDVMELTEKVDNAVKFLSDMFYARLYNLIAAKVGVPDYRGLVDQKLRTAGELYRFMVDQFNQTRSFVLELAVVIILIVDLAFLFRGK